MAQNPWNLSRSPGGSSGGEGGLTAARCNIVGLGSDNAGSIRIPASFCGVVGIKTGGQRVPNKGHFTMEIGSQSVLPGVQASIGPIAKNVDDCALFLSTLINPKNYENISLSEQDLFFKPIPFDFDKYSSQKKLKIGYISTYENCIATAANQRAVEIARKSLEKMGHELVEFQIPNIAEISHDFSCLLLCDGGIGGKTIRQGEKPIDAIKVIGFLQSNPILRKIIQFFCIIFRNPQIFNMMKSLNTFSAAEDRNLHFRIKNHREKFIKQMINQGIEAILCPSIMPAVKLELANRVSIQVEYAFIFNALNLPAGTLPVTLVQQNEQHYYNSTVKTDITKKFIDQSMQNSEGLPVSVQIVTLPNQEELCLNLMKQIEQDVKFNDNYKPQYREQ